uniref:Uncharacterized protein n=1 Tax=Leersia perrieri TaxID=77586 RepID=A0A0D9X5V4_9ORYZ
MSSSTRDYTPPKRKAPTTSPEGIEVPMCFCGDLCQVVKSDEYSDTYGRKVFLCDNYDYEPPRIFVGTPIRVKRRRRRGAKVINKNRVSDRSNLNTRKLRLVKQT